MSPLPRSLAVDLGTGEPGNHPPTCGAAGGSPHRLAAAIAGVAAGVLYCSWPLGFVLNRSTAAAGLASDLELRGQPFDWVFIGLDCATGVATIAVVAFFWQGLAQQRRLRGRLALVCYAAFGIFTGVDALIPSSCPSSQACSADLSALSLDDVLTGAAMVGLFGAALFALSIVNTPAPRRAVALALLVATVSWSIVGIVFFAHHFSTRPPVGLQHTLLTLSGVIAAIVPIAVARSRPNSVIGDVDTL